MPAQSESEPDEAAPQAFSLQGDELSLSGPALGQLMQAVLGRGAAFRFRAKGWSMQPFIKDGDVITVAPLGEGEPRIGDVVAYETGRPGIAVHRIVALSAGRFVIRGDNLSEIDGRVPRQRLVGRIVRVERNGRSVSLGLGRERVLVALLTRSGLFKSVLYPAWVRFRIWQKGRAR